MPEFSLAELVNPTDRQQEFLDVIAEYPFTLYGGAAGGGKSYILRWFAVMCVIKAFALHGVRNAIFGLFCEDFPALQQRHLICWNIPRWLGEVHGSRLEGLRFKLREDLGGGMVFLGNLDDPAKYDSAQFIGIAVDEWTKNPWSVFEHLRKRLRWPIEPNKPHLPCGGKVSTGKIINGKPQLVDCSIDSHRRIPAWNFPFAMGSNPGGQGHAETKRVFIDRKFSGTVAHLAPIQDKFAFVQAKADDNPYNPADYKEKNLDTLPAALRAKYAEGKWEVPEGQFFTNFELDRLQLSSEASSGLIQDWWPKWLATDWGFAHWCATFWFTRGLVSPEAAKKHLGREWDKARYVTIAYREYITRETDSPILAANIVSRTPEEERREIKSYFLSPDAKQKRDSGHTHQEEISIVMRQNKMAQPEDADNQRVAGWRFVYSMIERDELFISANCPELLDAIPQAIYDTDGIEPEDILKTSDISDDCNDALRYGLKSMLNPGRKPHDVVIREQLETTPDEMARHFIRLAETERRQRAKQPVPYWEQ